MTFVPSSRWVRRMDSVHHAARVAAESSPGTVLSPEAPHQRLTEAEQMAALAIMAVIAGTGAQRPGLLDDRPELDLEAAVWDVIAEGRHVDQPLLWLARVGYLVERSRRSRARRGLLG